MLAFPGTTQLTVWKLFRDMEESSLYVYGVTEQTALEFDADGVNGASRIYTVDSPPLSAVVSDVDTVEPEESEENLRLHNDVLQQVLEYEGGQTIVPMQFGMAFTDLGTLKNVLGEANEAFVRALDEVDGTVELGLKVVKPSDDSVDASAIRQHAAELFDDIAKATERGAQFSDRLVVNRSYLIDRSDQETFNEAVGEFQETHEDLLVQYTGPWPPYNFVDIQIGATHQ